MSITAAIEINRLRAQTSPGNPWYRDWRLRAPVWHLQRPHGAAVDWDSAEPQEVCCVATGRSLGTLMPVTALRSI